MINLEKITEDNFDDVVDLRVSDEQKGFVDTNLYCLAQAYVDLANEELPPVLFAITNDGEVIGLVAMDYYKLSETSYLTKHFGDKMTYEINHFMIDQRYQGKGLAKQAMQKIIEYIKTFPQGEADAISLSYWSVNDGARGVYSSVGFTETGDIWDGEKLIPWDKTRKDLDQAEVGARLGL